MCLQNMQCAQNRLYRCSLLFAKRGNQKQWPRQVKCSLFTSREYIIKRLYGEMPTTPHLSSVNGLETCGITTAARTDAIVSHTRQLPPKWSPVRVLNNARLGAANARNHDSDAHQCMHASIRLILTRFNKIATQGAPQMAVDKEANRLSRVYSYYSKFNLRLFYV